jgi:hypothetical protein
MREWTLEDAVVKQVMSNIRVNCAERVVQKDNLALIVRCSCYADPLPLTAG